MVPVAFVNWYPCLYLLGRDDPFGLPGLAAVLLARSPPCSRRCLAMLVWRTGVRHYTSTGA